MEPAGFLSVVIEKVGKENLTSLVVLSLIMAVIYFLDRKNFQKEGVLLLRRTKKGLDFINRNAEKYRNFYIFFGYLGVFFSLGLVGIRFLFRNNKKDRLRATVLGSAFVAVLLIITAYFTQAPTFYHYVIFVTFWLGGITSAALIFLFWKVVTALFHPATVQPSVQLVLPLKTQKLPVFYVPLPYWVVAILTIVVVHEFAHALVARAHNIKVKSMGYGFFAVIPLGFAEPDEGQLKRSGIAKKLSVYAAGSMSNLFFAFIFFLLFILLGHVVGMVFQPSGVEYSFKVNNTYAYSIIPESGVLTAINGTPVMSIDDLINILEKLKPNQTVVLTINGQNYTVKLSQNPQNSSLPFIGLGGLKNRMVVKNNVKNLVGEKVPWVLIYLMKLLQWLVFLNLGIGIANLLPIRPLDGGLMLEEVMKKARREKTFYLIEKFALILLILNIILPLILKYLSASHII